MADASDAHAGLTEVVWPVCRHRSGDADATRQTCHHPRVWAPAGMTAATCATCVFADRPIEVLPSSPRPWRTLPCWDLGPILSQTDAAGTPCRCPRKWLRRCARHGSCTLADETRRDVAVCVTCPDYEVGE